MGAALGMRYAELHAGLVRVLGEKVAELLASVSVG